MNYLLAVLTHGPDGDKRAAEAIERAHAALSPPPASIIVLWDGAPEYLDAAHIDSREGWPVALVELGQPASGFCGATADLWRTCSWRPEDYVFWLENDFEFERDVDLFAMGAVLGHPDNGDVCQMSLLRHPEQHELPTLVKDEWGRNLTGHQGEAFDWLEQTTYWTTNPSLIPIQVFREVAWPEGPYCEGKVAEIMRHRGFTFGVWGRGEPWVKHIGVRSGFGY